MSSMNAMNMCGTPSPGSAEAPLSGEPQALGRTTPGLGSSTQGLGSSTQQQRGEEFARLLLAKAAPADAPPGAKAEAKPDAKPGGKHCMKQDSRDEFDVSCLLPDPPLAAFAAALRCRFEAEAETTAETVDGVAAPSCADAHEAAGPAPETAPAAHTPEVSASRAAIEAALSSDPLPALTAAGSEAVWEASVREPHGVAVDMRASREAGGAIGAAPANWTLTVASPAMEAALLARHAPRLSERLRLRGVEQAHVRIDGDDTSE